MGRRNPFQSPRLIGQKSKSPSESETEDPARTKKVKVDAMKRQQKRILPRSPTSPASVPPEDMMMDVDEIPVLSRQQRLEEERRVKMKQMLQDQLLRYRSEYHQRSSGDSYEPCI